MTNLVLQIVPPIWPRLLDAALLFNDRALNDGAENAEGHGNSVVIVAVHADTTLQFLDGSTDDFKSVVEFDAVDTKFR